MWETVGTVGRLDTAGQTITDGQTSRQAGTTISQKEKQRVQNVVTARFPQAFE